MSANNFLFLLFRFIADGIMWVAEIVMTLIMVYFPIPPIGEGIYLRHNTPSQ